MKSPLIIKSFSEVLKYLDQFEIQTPDVKGEWTAYQHFSHCAQAIQYSIEGYPVLKPWWMQQTIGKLAFTLFNRRGYMRHDTNKLTPGSSEISDSPFEDGVHFLRSIIEEYDTFTGQIKPHEFYGKLSKKDLEKAHCMHIGNHFESFMI